MTACSFCNTNLEFLFKTKDLNRKVCDQDFVYLRCPACKLISIAEIPDDLGKYYSQGYYQPPALGKFQSVVRRDRFKMDMLKKFIKSGNLLEIGAGFGVFANQAKEAGFKVETIEMDGSCCEFLSKVVGVNAVQSDVPHHAVRAMGQHDVIAMWHVLEHLPKPWDCLEAVSNNLSSKGILAIAMPNPDAFQFKLMGASWPHVDAPRHLNLIPKEVLEEYLKKYGLELVMVTTDDRDARSWNIFGWQRYLMNRFSGKWMQRLCFVGGFLLSLPMALGDRKAFKGSAYTAIFQKKAVL